jgi:tripartite-type tricarboxylate transporter receptor subunit TctC
MMLSRRDFIVRSGLTSAFTFSVFPRAQAQSLEMSRIVIGFPAGSTVDGLGRALTKQLPGTFARNFIVENKPGVAGQLGAMAVKSAAPDGSALLLTPMTVLGVFPHTYKNLPYDPVADFTPVSNAVTFNYGLAVGSAVPATVTNAAQLMEWFRANPSKASIGNPALGSTLHFSGMLLARAAGVEVTHVGYIGGQLFTDVAGGAIPACVSTLGSLLPLHNSGRLRIIATTGEVRSPFLPNVGTLVEAGFKDLVFREWIGCFLPARAPHDVVQRIGKALHAALRSKDVTDVLSLQAQEPTPSTPEELEATLEKDIDLWRQRVRTVGFTSTT